MSEGSSRNAVVTLAVYPDTKEKWKKAVNEDPDADSLSQLIRVAVSRYLHEDTGSSEDALQEVHQQLTELNSQQNRLAQHLDEIKGQLTDIREAVTGSAAGPETEALAEDIFELIPTKKEVHTESVFPEDESSVPPPAHGSVDWLSEQFDVPRYQVQASIDHLQDTTYAVQQTDDGCYYKEV